MLSAGLTGWLSILLGRKQLFILSTYRSPKFGGQSKIALSSGDD
jgi:hypothetical protein